MMLDITNGHCGMDAFVMTALVIADQSVPPRSGCIGAVLRIDNRCM
jgi:hypothetical protein